MRWLCKYNFHRWRWHRVEWYGTSGIRLIWEIRRCKRCNVMHPHDAEDIQLPNILLGPPIEMS